MRTTIKNICDTEATKFLDTWLSDCEIVAIDQWEKNNGWIYAIYKSEGGGLRVASLPALGSGGKSTFFGDIKYYALLKAFEMAGIKPYYRATSSYPIWPAWYEKDENKLRKFGDTLREIEKTYNVSIF